MPTSEDINNLSYALKDTACWQNDTGKDAIVNLATHASLPMLSAHGQIHTTPWQEMRMWHIAWLGKLNSSAGRTLGQNQRRLVITMLICSSDWMDRTETFITQRLGLTLTRIPLKSNHTSCCRIVDAVRRFNTVLIDFNRDVWQYISLGYFKQN